MTSLPQSPLAPPLVPPLNFTVGVSMGSIKKSTSAALKGVKLVKKRPKEKVEQIDTSQLGEDVMDMERRSDELVNLE
jgi:hypothetical protein